MERYIDADELKNKVLIDMARAEQEGKDLHAYGECLFHLKTIPTAEVAREIFATIEAALHSAICVNRETEHSENTITNKLVCTSKENAYLTTLCFLNQLKKKYGVE